MLVLSSRSWLFLLLFVLIFSFFIIDRSAINTEMIVGKAILFAAFAISSLIQRTTAMDPVEVAAEAAVDTIDMASVLGVGLLAVSGLAAMDSCGKRARSPAAADDDVEDDHNESTPNLRDEFDAECLSILTVYVSLCYLQFVLFLVRVPFFFMVSCSGCNIAAW